MLKFIRNIFLIATCVLGLASLASAESSGSLQTKADAVSLEQDVSPTSHLTLEQSAEQNQSQAQTGCDGTFASSDPVPSDLVCRTCCDLMLPCCGTCRSVPVGEGFDISSS